MPRLVADGTLQYELTGSRYVAVHSPSPDDGDRMLDGSDAACRVSRLEAVVRDQQVQIEHLKSAVEDLQRKLCRLSKGASMVGQVRSPRSRVNGVTNGLDKVDGKRNRPALNVNSTECLTVTHYQSTNSLHSDGLSGSPSGSPISTPSPTYSQQRQLSTTASNLNKRWHSTSDFQRPLYPNGTSISSAAKARAYPGSGGNARRIGTPLSSALANDGSQRHLNGSHRDLYRQRRETQPNATPRRAVTGSLQDISRRRLQHQRNMQHS